MDYQTKQSSPYRKLNLVLFLMIVGLFPVGPVWAGAGSDGEDPCVPPDVAVRATLHIPNDTGQTADDFHMYMYQKDRPGVNVNGASANCDDFGNVGVGLDSDNRGGSPNVPAVPPGVGPPYHGADVDMAGGSVPAGGNIAIDIMLCMNEKNSIKFDYYWTSSGDPLPGGDPAGGFRAGGPGAGGGGGNTTDPGGGGQGAQGGGGGSGNYVHMICIENDHPTKCMLVTELKLLASMTYYADVDAIDWASIDPVKNDKNEPPVTIQPLGRWWYAFETTGDYIGGHIYMKFDMTAVPCGKSGDPKDAGGGTGMIGDHPVVEPSPDFDGDGLYDDWEFVFELSSTDDGSVNPDNGPNGDPDHDGITNLQEQTLLTNPRDPSLAEAVDNASLTWTTTGAAPWSGQTLVSHDGVDGGQQRIPGRQPVQRVNDARGRSRNLVLLVEGGLGGQPRLAAVLDRRRASGPHLRQHVVQHEAIRDRIRHAYPEMEVLERRVRRRGPGSGLVGPRHVDSDTDLLGRSLG